LDEPFTALDAEILVLAVSSGFAGMDLALIGAARLGAPFAEVVGLHTALMGGLGLGVLATIRLPVCCTRARSWYSRSARNWPDVAMRHRRHE